MQKLRNLMLILTLSVISIGLSSCEEDLLMNGATLIPGPWYSHGHYIEDIGYGTYKVTSNYVSEIYYLSASLICWGNVPEGCWPERYEPYFSPTERDLCWHVYCRGQFPEILIFKDGDWAPL